MRATPQMTNCWYPKKRKWKSKEPSTAEGREQGLKARPSASFSSLRAHRIVNQKQRPLGNTLLAQRYSLSGNSYLWRTGPRPTTQGQWEKHRVVRWRWWLPGRLAVRGGARFACFLAEEN